MLLYIPDGHTKEMPTAGSKDKSKAQAANTPIPSARSSAVPPSAPAGDLFSSIVAQGESVRLLKAAKAPKEEVDKAVQLLLRLKAQLKQETGMDYKPGMAPPAAIQAKAAPAPSSLDSISCPYARVAQQGEAVRKLKAKKAPKEQTDAAVKQLLGAKAEFKQLTGQEYKPGAAPAPSPAPPTTTTSSSVCPQYVEPSPSVL